MKDRFSSHAKQYASFRPSYPVELIRFLVDNCRGYDYAWDCGTGNGQVARLLSPYFGKVKATDISTSQLENADASENIVYSVQPAEQTAFSDNEFDLITVGQAIHWFNIDLFYREVKRTGKGGSLVAVFGYSPLRSDDRFNEILDDFYFNKIYPYWDTERKWVDDGYRTLEFPFDEFPLPKFNMNYFWTVYEVEGYITTWSAVKRYIDKHNTNPVIDLMHQLKSCWKSDRLDVYFPIFGRAGYIQK